VPCIRLVHDISIAFTLQIDTYIEQTIMADPFLLTGNHPHLILSVNVMALLSFNNRPFGTVFTIAKLMTIFNTCFAHLDFYTF